MDPSTVFKTSDMDQLAKIHRYHWKERLKINKAANFECYMLKTNEDVHPQKSRDVTHVCMEERGGGGGGEFCPPTRRQ